MIIKYNENAPKSYGPRYNGSWWIYDGIYITPQGYLFDVEGYSRVAHCYGFVIPFFRAYLYPHECGNSFMWFNKEHILEDLMNLEKILTTRYFFENQNAVKMRLALTRYFINCYKSSLTVLKQNSWNDYYSDLSRVIGQSTENQVHNGRYLLLKEILVQACNYDSIESQLPKTITTSKFNVNEAFYDWLLMDYTVCQIPKKIYSEDEEKYVDWEQPDFLKTDKELRLGEEIQAIKKLVPLNQRNRYFRGNYNKEDYNFYY